MKYVGTYLFYGSIFVNVISITQATPTTNKINKIYDHVFPPNKKKIKLRSITLFFMNDPQVKSKSSLLKNGLQEHVFLFSQTKVEQKIINQLNIQQDGYMVRLVQVENSTDVKLIIQLDPQKVGLGHDMFDSIGVRKKCLLISLFNKKLLEKLREPRLLEIAALQQQCFKKKILL